MTRPDSNCELKLRVVFKRYGLLLKCGDVAQLGEHLVCNQDVAGSIPVISTKI